MRPTLYFPVSGNPIGFNHLAMAEWVLRQNPNLQRVVFILSNGHHPDPTKPDAEVDAPTRQTLCDQMLAEVTDPERSYLARQAQANEEPLSLATVALELNTQEFAHSRAVRMLETVQVLLAAPEIEPPLDWVIGSDLLARMADARIFEQADLEALAQSCRFAAIEREAAPLQSALAAVQSQRGVSLNASVFPHGTAPDWLLPFLQLSSTRIRHAAEAGDPLGGMLTRGTAARVVNGDLYRPGRPAARLQANDGTVLRPFSRLELDQLELQKALVACTSTVTSALQQRHSRGQPHRLAVVETSTGGLLTTLLAGRAGASRYFAQSRFAYGSAAKAQLLGAPLPAGGAVSESTAAALAEALRREASVDFAVAESGMAGPPDGQRRSLKSGQCCIAVAGPGGTQAMSVRQNPWLTRREHQLHFACAALELLNTCMTAGPEARKTGSSKA